MTAELIQGSPEWLAARVGKVTASRISDAVAKTKNGWGTSRANYMAELIAETLTGQPYPQYQSVEMRRGTEVEPDARRAYEFMADASVEQVGFISHPSIAMSGASPDGVVGDDGLVEIKCPNTATHIDTLLGANLDGAYITQMQWQMACTGRAWCDFISYDPRLPAHLALFVKRTARDDKRIAELETMVKEFIDELTTKVAALSAINQGKGQ